MNTYYAEFHARDSIDRWQGEAEEARLVKSGLERTGRRMPGRSRVKRRVARVTVLAGIASVLLGLFYTLPAAAGGANTDRITTIERLRPGDVVLHPQR